MDLGGRGGFPQAQGLGQLGHLGQLGPFRKHLGPFGTPKHTFGIKMENGHVSVFQDRSFPEKKTPAAELRNHLGFHKEPIRDQKHTI